MFLRVGETAIVTVFNDAKAALSIYVEESSKIGGPLSPLQVREMAARLASINVQLLERPRFSTEVDLLSEECSILGHAPEELRIEWQDEIHGKIMHHICKDLLLNSAGKEQILEGLKTGRYTFLIDSNGNFPRDHMELDDSVPET